MMVVMMMAMMAYGDCENKFSDGCRPVIQICTKMTKSYCQLILNEVPRLNGAKIS